ncbi:MAG: hypothetical protein HZC25_01580 [Rhodospirillales bacterium]|nr:hypothetical protein [Rhodospirillales bacterium]
MTGERALVTLTIGDDYQALFESRLRANWQAYAARHDYDLVVFDRPLDDSARAQARSPAWQKCLIFERPELTHYRQLVWIDSDIVLNIDRAPAVGATVPDDKVGGVDAYAMPTPEIFAEVLARMYAAWRAMGAAFLDSSTPDLFYRNRGLAKGPERVMHTGVLVASPRHHARLFRTVYDGYEDQGGKLANYEWAPLSAEIVAGGHAHWLDCRFNLILSDQIAHHYPFLHGNLFAPVLAQGQEAAAQALQRLVFDACLKAIYDNAYFLHFSGLADLLKDFRP